MSDTIYYFRKKYKLLLKTVTLIFNWHTRADVYIFLMKTFVLILQLENFKIYISDDDTLLLF